MGGHNHHFLFANHQLGPFKLRNRVVMAPMTRCRCIDNLPNDLVAKYYAQRAEAGLMITEGTSPSDNGLGYARMPGLFANEHVRAWKKVTEAVHEAGSKIFVQLMHCGRISHPLNMPSGVEILAPSPIAHNGEMWTDQEGMQPLPEPEEMTDSDVLHTIEEFAHSAELAMLAGFDGVEIHGANGYLVEQFLNTASNKRNDRWGGSVENRSRFAIEVTKAVAKKIGPEKVGIRLSPYGVFNGMEACSHTDDLYELLAVELQKLGILYIHLVDHSSMGAPPVKDSLKQTIREKFKGALILSGGYNLRKADADLSAKKGDLIAFGRPFIANPKLVSKMKNHQNLIEPNANLFYTAGEEGYTDYPLE
jgi:N-ethylmaleimide reductase